ncbi:MAG: hypothetical protein K5868_03765 [Lachnospiraceae bacterium]|nr:hypothetical protein [Lachnospiraceae bacterium]
MKRRFKRALSIIVVLVLALSLISCGSKSSDDDDDDEEVEEVDEDYEEVADAVDEAPFCVGYWKYDDYPVYLVIADDLQWVAYDDSGNATYRGNIEEHRDGYLMYYEGESEPEEVGVTEDGKLIDQDGSTLSRMEKFDLNASMNDKLTEVAYFPGKFEAFSINYPSRLEAKPRTDLANTLMFSQRTVENGSPDYYSNILVTFQPLVDVDQYMGKGAALAQKCMGYLLNNAMNAFYGPYIKNIIGSDFQDMGSYYRITGYMWLDGSVYPDSGLDQVLGVVQMRYFGPTGYAMYGITIAPVDVVENYYGICLNMLDTCTYKTDWSTAPKVVPKQAGKNKGKTKQKKVTKKVTGSDPGDYVDTFYWTDEDGDIWYWNGYENVFQSFGSDGYIDDDGEYYESNDAGWDTGDYEYQDDYDLFSDPGDNDIDEWSDPGDYSDAGDYDDYGGYDDFGDDDW